MKRTELATLKPLEILYDWRKGKYGKNHNRGKRVKVLAIKPGMVNDLKVIFLDTWEYADGTYVNDQSKNMKKGNIGWVSSRNFVRKLND